MGLTTYNTMKTLLSLLPIATSFLSYSQSDTLNQIDSNGLKQGYWTVYLDDEWKKVDEKSDATYMRYAYYINGGNLYPMSSWKNAYISMNGEMTMTITGNPILLDGTFTWYDKKGRLLSRHVLKNGVYQSYEYYYKSEKLKGGFTTTEQCGETALDYCVFLCDKEGSIKSKWPILRDESGKPINKE